MRSPLSRTVGRSTELQATPTDLCSAFLGCLEWATDVYIGVAWARSGWPIKELASRRSLKVHAVVGRSFDMTVPDAIEALYRLGNDTWVWDKSDPLFHPKLYLFHHAERVEAIIGSANLTNAAFLSNAECAVHLVLSLQEQGRWMNAWKSWRADATKVTDRWLAEYRKTWCPPSSGHLKKLAEHEDISNRRKVENSPSVSTPEVLAATWPVYESMLLHAAKRGEHNWLADDEKGYRAALRELRPVVAGDLPPAQSVEFSMLVGRKNKHSSIDYGWFGQLTGSGKALSGLASNKRLRRDLNAMLGELKMMNMSDDAGNEAIAKRIWERVCREDGLSVGVASRLLTLTRPERFFSVNGGSLNGLARALEVSKASMKTWEGYSDTLNRLWNSPWFRSAPPRARLSREMWDARVALIDVLVYQHK